MISDSVQEHQFLTYARLSKSQEVKRKMEEYTGRRNQNNNKSYSGLMGNSVFVVYEDRVLEINIDTENPAQTESSPLEKIAVKAN